jgi:uncharacterized protein YndB with AHSA1/START domain
MHDWIQVLCSTRPRKAYPTRSIGIDMTCDLRTFFFQALALILLLAPGLPTMTASDVTVDPGSPADTEQTFTIRRDFAATRDQIFKAWTEPALLAQWLLPGGDPGTTPQALAVGKTCLYSSRTGDTVQWGKWVVLELVPPGRLVYLESFCDEHGTSVHQPGNPQWPLQLRTTVLLTEHAGTTTVDLAWTPVEAKPGELAAFHAAFGGMSKGWGHSFDRLAALVAKP